MPIIKSAIKRVKQASKHRDRNVKLKRDMKSAMKAFMAAPSSETLSEVHSTLDTAVKKNLLKPNTAARRKARVSRIAKEAGVKLTSAKKTAAKKPAAEKKAPAKAAKKPTATKTKKSTEK